MSAFNQRGRDEAHPFRQATTLVREPSVRCVMAHMRGIDQGDENVDVEQKRHGSSSRNALTISSVTTGLPFCTGRRGTPLRSRSAAGLRKERRAKSETTSPTVLPCFRNLLRGAEDIIGNRQGGPH